nr:MAG TPA: hypothetical protein [Caudoviricetes sp.]
MRVPVSIKVILLKAFSFSQSFLLEILEESNAWTSQPFWANPRAISKVNTGPAPSLNKNVIRIFFCMNFCF